MSERVRMTCPCCKAKIVAHIGVDVDLDYVEPDEKEKAKVAAEEELANAGHPADPWTKAALAAVPPQITRPESVDALLAMGTP